MNGLQYCRRSDAINYAIDTVFSGVSAEDRPIIGLLLENEEYPERYHECLSELVEYITSGQYLFSKHSSH